jgi:NAD(P)-dependent dehydrogenase (short-subunit alcohol dehydrogenase family)
MEVKDRVVVVTGGASGIGRAMAERFAAEGARGVIVADVDAAGAVQVAAGIGKTALGIHCDVTDDAAVGDVLEEAENAFGPVEIFCANAGIGIGAALDADDEVWSKVMDVNVRSHVLAARRLVPAWLERGEGYFVSTASAAGLLSQIGDVTYAVSKHAAVAFAEWLAITYGARGVRVSCLCPMGVDTPLLRAGLETDSDEGLGARIVAAAGSLLAPEQVAGDVVEAMREERFLILPHPEVGEFFRRRGADHDRWLKGMQRLQERVSEAMRQQ